METWRHGKPNRDKGLQLEEIAQHNLYDPYTPPPLDPWSLNQGDIVGLGFGPEYVSGGLEPTRE